MEEQKYAFEALYSRPSPDQTPKGTVSRFLLALTVYTLISFVFVIVTQIVLLLIQKESLLENAGFSVALSSVSMYLVGLPFLWLIVRRMPTVRYEKRKLSLSELLVIFLISRAFIVAGSLLSNILAAIGEAALGYTLPDTTTELVEACPIPLLILFVVIIGPVVEELIFRKWILDRLGAWGEVYAILVSSAVFGIAHGNLYQFFYTFFLGMIFAYVYTKTGNILYPIALHVLTNFLGSVAVLPFLGITEELESLLLSPEENLLEIAKLALPLLLYSVVNYGLAIAGLVLFILNYRKLRFDSAEISLSPSALCKHTFLNVGAILFLIVSVVQFILNSLPIS